MRSVQSERIEAALIRWQIPRAEQPIHEVEEASVIRLATGRSGRMMRAVVPGRVQDYVPQATLEIGVRMIEQPRNAGVNVVEDDKFVTGADHEHREGSRSDSEEDVDGIEVRGPQHLEPRHAMVNGVYPPQPGHFVSRSVVPVLEEVYEERRQQQLERDRHIPRPDVE